jgi:phage tail protein X
LGFYRAATDDTVEFMTRKVVTKGNTVVSFIYEAAKK